MTVTEPAFGGPYTVELANRALPLVRRIVGDLVSSYAKWQEAVSRFEYATTRSTAAAPDPDAERLQALAEEAAEEIEGFVRELDELGVECRAFEAGVVVFPGERGDERVELVWRSGEPSVRGPDDYDPASAKGISSSRPSRAHPVTGNTSFASRSRSDGSRE